MVKASQDRRTKVLFVCIGNSCRSQIAEALARHLASDVIEPVSAGLSPLGSIAEGTRKVLRERGIFLGEQYSKGLNEISIQDADLIVNMTGMPGKALFAEAEVVDWDIRDPYGEDMLIYREVCEEIEERLAQLAAELRSRQAAT
jgi:arsenate reductase